MWHTGAWWAQWEKKYAAVANMDDQSHSEGAIKAAQHEVFGAIERDACLSYLGTAKNTITHVIELARSDSTRNSLLRAYTSEEVIKAAQKACNL
jgi:hypothetical protein